jgi:hypothetical protein
MKLTAFLRVMTGQSSGKILWLTRGSAARVPKTVSADFADYTDSISIRLPGRATFIGPLSDNRTDVCRFSSAF